MSATGRLRGLWARPEVRWLTLITVFAAALRFSTLGLQSFAYDEVFTVDRVLHPGLWKTLHTVRVTESTPPLYYVVAWFWTKVFGTGEVGIRSLSALAGTAMVPVAYGAAATLSSKRVGLLAALFVAVNPALWWYSQQARSYILVALLVTAGLFFFAKALKENDGRWLAGWAVASALAAATHYFAAFLVVPEAVWLLVAVPRTRALWLSLAGVAAAGLALLPLAIDQQRAGHADYISNVPLGSRLEQVPKLFMVGPQGSPHLGLVLLMVAIAAIAAYLLYRAPPEDRRPAGVWGLLAAAGLLLPVLASLAGIDFLFARNLLPAFVPLILVLAVAAGTRAAGRVGLAAALALSAYWLGVVIKTDTDPGWQRLDWAWAARQAGPPQRPRLIVVNSLGELPLGHYMPVRLTLGFGPVREVDFAGEKLSAQLANAHLPASLVLVETRSRGGLQFRRYVSPTPVLVNNVRQLGEKVGAHGTVKVLIDIP